MTFPSPLQLGSLRQGFQVQRESSVLLRSSVQLQAIGVRSSLDQLRASWQQEFDELKVGVATGESRGMDWYTSSYLLCVGGSE